MHSVKMYAENFLCCHIVERRAVHTSSSLHNHTDKRPSTTEVLSNLANEVARESLTSMHTSSASNSPALKMFSSVPSTSISYNLGHIGAGSNAAIAAAASQAIAATNQVGVSVWGAWHVPSFMLWAACCLEYTI